MPASAACLRPEAKSFRGRLSLGLAPFVAKRNTPLDGTPFVGVREVERRIAMLRHGLKGRVEVRATSSRWAWVEYELAQGGWQAGYAAYRAWLDGASYAAFRRAFAPQHAAAGNGPAPTAILKSRVRAGDENLLFGM